jgi:hypothetical protein
MIDTDPGGFVRVVVQVLPDKLEVDVKHTISRIERVIVDHRPRAIEHEPAPLVGTSVGTDKSAEVSCGSAPAHRGDVGAAPGVW